MSTVLNELYSKLDGTIAEFSGRAGLSCPSGCGTCCETFVPDLTPAEADLIAARLLQDHQILTIDSWTTGELEGACPFYRVQGDPYHCRIYPVRPLICRLFGFAGSRNKQGEAVFRRCRHMSGTTPPDLEITLLMGPYGLRLEALSPGAVKLSIGDAVRDSLSRLLLTRRMRGQLQSRDSDAFPVPSAG